MTRQPISLEDFIAYDLPAKKALKLFPAKMRVRVRVGKREFVSSTVKVGNRGETAESMPVSCAQWDDDFSRLELDDDEVFEVEIEKRRFLGWYKCIRRTEPTTIRKIIEINDADDSLFTLPLYDGQGMRYVGHGGQGITMGKITFTPTFTTEGSLSESSASAM